jgi:choline dehydrogenase
MPAALPFPIGSRFYDWKYESEPEPHMNGRRIYHARGKVLGGSSSINGMIFQRGNPMDYERWAADPGMEPGTTPTACPTSSAWRLPIAGADEWRGGSGPLSSNVGPATNPLFGAFFAAAGRRASPHRRRQRLPPGGLRPLRPQRQPGRRLVRGPRLPAPGDEPPNLHVAPWPSPPDPLRGHPGTGVEYTQLGRHPHRRGGRGGALRRRDQHPAAAPALRRRQPRRARAARHRPRRRRSRASASTSRTTSRSTSSTRASSRSRSRRG